MGENTNRAIQSTSITQELKDSYIDYAMSVIIGRALPDVRDGLKPVHRRILYAMNELGLTPERQFRKSVRIVGDVLGKFHPHGDASVYDAMVRMAQDFSMRYTTVQGHGNFGSVDGDSAAAMRYTEAKLDKIAMEMLRDINKDTVEFMDNFDGSETEPEVLPSRFPHLLVNGSQGIAVGMSTNIPPHNLGEVIDACIAYINDPDITVERLMHHLKGPDFPTGGIIVGTKGIRDTYETGSGKIVIRSKTEIVEKKKGRDQIIITEIPYMVNKANLIKRIAELVNSKKIEGISEIRDESNLQKGIQIIIEVKRDANAEVILNQLYKYTLLQTTFSANMLALVKDKKGNAYPKVLNLKEILTEYINFQEEVIERRTRFDLNKAEKRAHILEGLIVALDNIDEVISLIRSSQDRREAQQKLEERFELSNTQSEAILDMRLQRLTGLEREKLMSEYNELMELIKELRDILSDEQKLLGIVKEELLEIKENYGDERKTSFTEDQTHLDIGDYIDEEDVVITITKRGYAKRLPLETYRSQRRGGKGIIGLAAKEDDFIEHLFTMSTHHDLLIFTNEGKVYRLKGYDIPNASRVSSGQPIVNLLAFGENEKVTTFIPIQDFEENADLVMVTRKGMVKRTSLAKYNSSRNQGIIAINLREGDELVGVHLLKGESDIIVGTHDGMSIRFSSEEVNSTGRDSIGVKAIALRDDDYIVGMDLVKEGDYILCISEKGSGKLTPESSYNRQKRSGLGIKTYKITNKTGKMAGLLKCALDDEILLINNHGIVVRMQTADISQSGRNTQGVRLMKLKEDETIASVSKVYQQFQKDVDDESVLDQVELIEEEIEEDLS